MDLSQEMTGIVAVSWGRDRIDIFGVQHRLLTGGRDYSPAHPLMHHWYDGHIWQGPEFLGPALGEGYRTLSPMGVSTCLWGEGRLDVFALESDSNDLTRNYGLLHKYYDGGQWSYARAFMGVGPIIPGYEVPGGFSGNLTGGGGAGPDPKGVKHINPKRNVWVFNASALFILANFLKALFHCGKIL